jgi:L-threonylcarbamoyladenylate synthase
MMPDNIQSEQIADAVALLQYGGVVVFPTRCLYGLAVDAFNADAVARLYRIKKRAPSKPVSILVPTASALDSLVTEVPEAGRRLVETVWPGRLTVVLPAAASVPKALTAGTGTIGIRLPAHPVAAKLVNDFGGAITATSANPTGSPGCSDISRLDPELARAVDLVIDDGALEGGVGSSILDMTNRPYLLIREGAVRMSELADILGRGEICR